MLSEIPVRGNDINHNEAGARSSARLRPIGSSVRDQEFGMKVMNNEFLPDNGLIYMNIYGHYN